MIFNQFEEFGNYLWHYEVTGHAMEEVLKQVMGPKDHYRGMASATGSAGTIASGDYMKQLFPDSKIVASEALQCPTLLENGFGAHRIEGIGDKHVPVDPQLQEHRHGRGHRRQCRGQPDAPVQRAGRTQVPGRARACRKR